MINQTTIIQLDRLLKDQYDKYRELKQKMDYKVHERDTTINELRSNL